MAHDRLVAGIRCLDVLELLSEYVDGELDEATRTRIEGHVRGCDWCERFGGAFGGVVAALKSQLATADPPPEGVTRRLWERLEEAEAE